MEKVPANRKRIWDQDIHRERMFLFLSIIVITIFLISAPGSLNSTFSFLTGASVSGVSAAGSSYLVGIIIFVVVLIGITLFFHAVREPKNVPIINLPEEKKLPLRSLKNKAPLTERLDRINQEIRGLRKEEAPFPPKISKKTIKTANVRERGLKRELEKVDTELHGYSRPTVIKAPKREEKLRSSRSYVEKKLSELPDADIKKVKIMTSLPEMRKVMEPMEKARMKEELKNLSLALSRGKKNPLNFLQRFPWKKEKRDFQKIREELKTDLPKSDLQEIEEKLRRIKKDLQS